VVLKDLTVTDCNPDQPLYVNYEEGKSILDGYLEKFWCLTALGEDIIKRADNHMQLPEKGSNNRYQEKLK